MLFNSRATTLRASELKGSTLIKFSKFSSHEQISFSTFYKKKNPVRITERRELTNILCLKGDKVKTILLTEKKLPQLS